MFGIEGLTAIWKTNASIADAEFWGDVDKSKREGIPIEMWRATRRQITQQD